MKQSEVEKKCSHYWVSDGCGDTCSVCGLFKDVRGNIETPTKVSKEQKGQDGN